MRMDHEETIQIDVLTPLSGSFFPDEDYDIEENDEGYFSEDNAALLNGEDLAQYQETIQEMVERENALCSENGEPCNLMDYFDGDEAIKENVISAVVSVKEIDGVLYGCTTLQMKETMDSKQMEELFGYITGQYSDGWGEGFEQRDIAVDGGTLNVHFYQFDNFHFTQMEHGKTPEPSQTPSAKKMRPKLKLLGHDGNIYSILGDASRLLRRNNQGKEAEEMIKRVHQSDNYYEALHIISEYVETELSGPREPKEKPPKTPKKEGDCR